MTKEHKRKKIMTALLLTSCIACLLCGCGGAGSISDELNQPGEESSETASPDDDVSFQMGTLAESLGIKSGTWAETISVGKQTLKEIQIDVEVKLPDTDHMCVVDLERKNLSSADGKEIIGKVFDDGKVGVLEETCYPKWKLEQLIEEYEKKVASEKENKELPEGWLSKDEAKLDNYRMQIGSATNNMSEPMEYGRGAFWGFVNDKEYQLTISEGTEGGYSLLGEMADYSKGIVSELVMDYEQLCFFDEDNGTENASTFSKEYAVNQATNFLHTLGYDEYIVNKVAGMRWYAGCYGEDTAQTFVEGYTVYFCRMVDGVEVETRTDKYILDNTSDQVDVMTYSDEEAWVSLTDVGIISFGVQNPRTMKATSLTETPLLAFESIKESIRTCINRRSNENYFHTNGEVVVKLNQMDLIYMVLTDDGLTVVPVWRIYGEDTRFQSDSIDNYILINAIDGSEIDYRTEYYKMISYEDWEKQFKDE